MGRYVFDEDVYEGIEEQIKELEANGWTRHGSVGGEDLTLTKSIGSGGEKVIYMDFDAFYGGDIAFRGNVEGNSNLNVSQYLMEMESELPSFVANFIDDYADGLLAIKSLNDVADLARTDVESYINSGGVGERPSATALVAYFNGLDPSNEMKKLLNARLDLLVSKRAQENMDEKPNPADVRNSAISEAAKQSASNIDAKGHTMSR